MQWAFLLSAEALEIIDQENRGGRRRDGYSLKTEKEEKEELPEATRKE